MTENNVNAANWCVHAGEISGFEVIRRIGTPRQLRLFKSKVGILHRSQELKRNSSQYYTKVDGALKNQYGAPCI